SSRSRLRHRREFCWGGIVGPPKQIRRQNWWLEIRVLVRQCRKPPRNPADGADMLVRRSFGRYRPNFVASHTVFGVPVGIHRALAWPVPVRRRSEEHTSELQSRLDLLCLL